MTPARRAPPLRREERFVRERMERWEELEQLVDAARRRGFRSFGEDGARRLGELYRTVASDLALAQTLCVSPGTIAHLNRLCVATHNVVYASSRASPARRTAGFLTGGFPSLVRETWRYHAFAALVLFGSAVVAYLAYRADPALAREAVGSDMYLRALHAKELADSSSQYIEMPSLSRPFFSWGLVANNVNVSLMLFAMGALAGVGTVLLLAVNGLHIGGAVAVFAEVGVSGSILTWMSAHGPMELGAICIAGGAGLRMGASLLLPGQKSRAHAFRDAAIDSVRLLGGTAVMLVFAGLLEAFVSPAEFLAPPAKWAVGAVTLAGLAAYFGLAGRDED